MVFKQSFKYLKNEKINFIKVILKLEFFLSEHIYFIWSYFIFVEPFLLQKRSNRKKITPYEDLFFFVFIGGHSFRERWVVVVEQGSEKCSKVYQLPWCNDHRDLSCIHVMTKSLSLYGLSRDQCNAYFEFL